MGFLRKLLQRLRPSPDAGNSPDDATPVEPPISYENLRALFDYLNRPDPPPCTHTHKETIEFLKARDLPVEPTTAWLRANGGFCDCEVIFNVADKWRDEIGWNPPPEDDE